MSERSSCGRTRGRHAMPMLKKGTSWRINHAQLRYHRMDRGTLEKVS